jgi:hypothetical protein
MQRRFSYIFRIRALVGNERPPHRHERKVFVDILADVLGPDLERLGWPPLRIAHIIRLVSFASAFPQLNDGIEFTPEELASIVLHGIAHSPISTESQD